MHQRSERCRGACRGAGWTLPEAVVGLPSLLVSSDTGVRQGHADDRTTWLALPLALGVIILIVAGCGYRFSGGPGETPFPPDLKTIVLESATNNTTITGIETELTNDLRREFALSTRLEPVNSGGDVILKTLIASYDDTPATYKADGKELTRIGTLRVACSLGRTDTKEVLWNKKLASSYTYTVTDTIAGTLANRRRAISQMIKDLIPRIHRSLYDNF